MRPSSRQSPVELSVFCWRVKLFCSVPRRDISTAVHFSPPLMKSAGKRNARKANRSSPGHGNAPLTQCFYCLRQGALCLLPVFPGSVQRLRGVLYGFAVCAWPPGGFREYPRLVRRDDSDHRAFHTVRDQRFSKPKNLWEQDLPESGAHGISALKNRRSVIHYKQTPFAAYPSEADWHEV